MDASNYFNGKLPLCAFNAYVGSIQFMERDAVSVMLADNIRALMDERGMGVPDLTRAAEINQTGIYDILKGRSRSPKVETVAKIARALNVPIAELFMTPDEGETLRSIVRVFSYLPEAEKRRLLTIAEALATSSEQTEAAT